MVRLFLIIPSLIFNSDNLYPTTFTDWGLVFIYGAVMQCVAWGMIAYTIPYLSLGLNRFVASFRTGGCARN